ncbi:amino acid adenylation domain protein [Crepidotus variabilis]|uniref:Amino acid adenylation domain protein n=1 Tax=Crepidotus variabilis TaxID=179855 RepID=A0A9P6JQD8_9AGAR|nr:amino acid adenylation domain protein [Crepidotus variabilis]
MSSIMPFLTGAELPPNPSLRAASEDGKLPSEVVAIFPMTRGQEGLWLAYTLAPHHTLYNLTMKFSFTKETKSEADFSVESLNNAINTLTRRHALLRSTFHEADDKHDRPFIAEWDPNSAMPVLEIVTKPKTPQAEAKVQSILRTAVDLSSTFAVRWVVVLKGAETELFLVSHHIALDGGSMSQLSRELFDLLAIKSEDSPPVKEVAVESFSRAHMLEASFSDSPDFETAKAFWARQSKNVRPIKWTKSPSLDNGKNYREIQTWFELPNTELREWGNRYKTSWFRVAVALIGVLIRSVSEPEGGADQAVTVAFGGRPGGMENSVGQFANALPMRVPLAEVLNSKAPTTFDTLVKLVGKEVSAAKKYDRLSFLDVTDAHREAGSQIPPSQVAITLSPKLSRPECSLYPVEGPYDLFFCFLEGETSVTLGVIYNPLIFSQADVLTLKNSFASLRKLTEEKLPLSLSSLPALKPHLPSLLPELDLNDVAAIDAARFHTWFENRALQNPELLALHSGEHGLSSTYKELNEVANRKAHYLRSQGISRGSIVLLYLSRGFGMMEWIIAVLKSGAAFAVADQAHPELRTSSVISIAQPAVILDDRKGRDLTNLHTNILDVSDLFLDDMSTENLEDVTQNDDLAYIVFTSGSTGLPKGVEIEHRNLSHFVADSYTSGYVSISPGSRVLQFATFAFDAAVLEWSQCLTLGGTLCFADVPQALVGDYLADVIDANEISFFHVTPSVLATLPTSRALPSLRQISVGGEMVPENLIKAWRTRVHVQNAYGPTECTVVMSHQSQPREAEEKQPLASIIGAPHHHMKFVVADETFTKLLAVDQIGEVCIGGPQVGRGYRGRDDLTVERFATHPETGERLYRTGDRGKLLADGSVLLVGRIDREVKLRGYRIELDDVERTISDTTPGITSVSVQPDEAGSALVAFVAPRSIDGHLLKSVLAKRLPSYMIPASVYSLDTLPLNTNDKVDHKTIRATMKKLITEARPYSQESAPVVATTLTTSHSSELAPSASPSEVQPTIAQIWKEVLNLPHSPSPSDNFFSLGGNSTIIQSLVSRLKTAFSLTNLRVVELYSHPTIVAQAELINKRAPAFPRQAEVVSQPLPATPLPSQSEDIEAGVTEIWKSVLDVEELSSRTNFFDAGGSSILVSQILAKIRTRWPLAPIKIIDLFRHSTIQSQSALVTKHLPVIATPVQTSTSSIPFHSQRATSAPSSLGSEIAIVGLAGRFPGASSADELFQLFLDKRDGLTTYTDPSSKDLPFKDAIYIPKRGAIPNVQEFDPARWGIKEDEAKDMDPQQRLFLGVTHEALKDAGHLPTSDVYNSIGLCVGAAHNTWDHINEPIHGDDFHKAHHAILTPSISARTAYHLNLHGPNLTLNTACSSGMVAMSLAVDHLRSGKCDISVAGGVSIAFPQEGYMTAKHQLFSPSGHCRPFDHRADGTLPGDAVCALVLRRLEDAIRDGDKIYSVVSGIAIGSDGSTEKAGPTVPSPRGQANTIVRAWKDSNLDASKLFYAELHGSGTAIGDALELEGINLARTELNAEKVPITAGSNKGNLGNCEAAGAIVSVIKMCKSMEHGIIPGMPSFQRPNAMINTDLPIKLAANDIPLPPNSIVSVSSTGLGGVNAHCVLRTPPASSQRVSS